MKHFLFHVKKSSDYAEHADVSELCGSAAPHPVRCTEWCFYYYTLKFQEYIGNKDQNTLVINDLIEPIKAQYVRILPQEWHGHISMRMELYGCDSSKYLLRSL